MFQCIIQPRNGIIHNSGEMKGVFPGATKRSHSEDEREEGIQKWSWMIRAPNLPSLIYNSDSGCQAPVARICSFVFPTLANLLQNIYNFSASLGWKSRGQVLKGFLTFQTNFASAVLTIDSIWCQCWQLTQSGASVDNFVLTIDSVASWWLHFVGSFLAFMSQLANERACACSKKKRAEMLNILPFLLATNAVCFSQRLTFPRAFLPDRKVTSAEITWPWRGNHQSTAISIFFAQTQGIQS